MIRNRPPLFFPALSVVFSQYVSKSEEELKKGKNNFTDDKNIYFYNKGLNPYFYHPYVLFSAAHHYKIPDLRKDKKIGDDALIFLDSGGFQKSQKSGFIGDEFKSNLILEWCEENGYPTT